jgi:type I restriction enzyme M protein
MEVEENEFNLNLPRYVDTAEPEEEIGIEDTVAALKEADEAASQRYEELLSLLGGLRDHER